MVSYRNARPICDLACVRGPGQHRLSHVTSLPGSDASGYSLFAIFEKPCENRGRCEGTEQQPAPQCVEQVKLYQGRKDEPCFWLTPIIRLAIDGSYASWGGRVIGWIVQCSPSSHCGSHDAIPTIQPNNARQSRRDERKLTASTFTSASVHRPDTEACIARALRVPHDEQARRILGGVAGKSRPRWG